MHPVEDESAWSESYYFNGYDPDADVGIYTRIGIRPNEGTIDVTLASWQPDNQIAFVQATREQREMCESPLEVGGVRYVCRDEGKLWHLTADSEAVLFDLETRDRRKIPFSLDLEFEALIPMIGVDGQGTQAAGASASTSQSTGKGHLEQAGRWTGWIEADGNRQNLGDRARGNRDKSWGPRRWGGPRMWRWFSINISDDVHFGGIRIGTESGDLHRGWVWRDGVHTSLVEWRVRTETRDDGVTQKTCFVTAVDKLGREHELQADVMRVFVDRSSPSSKNRVTESKDREKREKSQPCSTDPMPPHCCRPWQKRSRTRSCRRPRAERGIRSASSRISVGFSNERPCRDSPLPSGRASRWPNC